MVHWVASFYLHNPACTHLVWLLVVIKSYMNVVQHNLTVSSKKKKENKEREGRYNMLGHMQHSDSSIYFSAVICPSQHVFCTK